MQYQHVLARTDASLGITKNRVTEIRREVNSFSELLAQAQTHHLTISTELEQDEAQLRIMKEHLNKIRAKREKCKQDRIALLREKHIEVDEEWSQAKTDKAKSMGIRKNILWLNNWLDRQRNVRKVLRLHSGLEEMAKVRFDRLVNRVVTCLAGRSVDEALVNYQTVIAKNKSLLQEAEYKLSLQALYERKVSALATELQWVKQMLAQASPAEYRMQIDKSEIHFPGTVERMKTAEQDFRRAVNVKEINKMSATKVVTQFDTLLTLLNSIDPRGEGAAVTTVHFHTDLAQAFLLLEKRLVFILTVTAQRQQTRELLRTLKLEVIKSTGSVESLLKLLKSTPRMRENRLEGFLIRLNSTHPSLKAVESSEQLSTSKESSTPRSFTSYRKNRKFRSLRSLKTLKRLSSPKEFFTERMRLYKDFELLKRTYGSSRKAAESTLEMLFTARQQERQLVTMTQGPQKPSKERKSEKSVSDRQRALLATARSYLSTRSETFSNVSKSSNRLK